MIRPEETTGPSAETHDASRAPLPASTRVYVEGQIHPSVRVPMREITLSDTKSFNGRIETNEPVRVYDCSGPWGDPAFTGTSEEGLPALRRDWILAARRRGGDTTVAKCKPQDNGYLSGKHAEYASKAEKQSPRANFPASPPSAAARSAPRPARSSRSSPTPAQASSRPRWNSSPSARTWDARRLPNQIVGFERRHRPQRPQQAARRQLPTPQSAIHDPDYTPIHLPPLPAAHPRARSPRSSSAPKSPPAAPSSRTTSITPSPSR